MKKSKATTKIRVHGETWRVPRGFGALYLRLAERDLALFREGKPGKIIGDIRDVLLLVGYEASISAVADWPLRKRVEVAAWAATEYARASDNPIQRHPPLPWLTERPWNGTWKGEGVFAGPSPTVIV